MEVTVSREAGFVKVTKDKEDQKFYSESVFLHHVKKELLSQGYDVVKKLMWKDGHLVSDTQHYIRDREGRWAIWNAYYSIYGAHEKFNDFGKVILQIIES